MDSTIERIERRIFALLSRKTILTRQSVMTLKPLWSDMVSDMREMDRALADLLVVVNV